MWGLGLRVRTGMIGVDTRAKRRAQHWGAALMLDAGESFQTGR